MMRDIAIRKRPLPTIASSWQSGVHPREKLANGSAIRKVPIEFKTQSLIGVISPHRYRKESSSRCRQIATPVYASKQSNDRDKGQRQQQKQGQNVAYDMLGITRPSPWLKRTPYTLPFVRSGVFAIAAGGWAETLHSIKALSTITIGSKTTALAIIETLCMKGAVI